LREVMGFTHYKENPCWRRTSKGEPCEIERGKVIVCQLHRACVFFKL
jgi:hypothetical protein